MNQKNVLNTLLTSGWRSCGHQPDGNKIYIMPNGGSHTRIVVDFETSCYAVYESDMEVPKETHRILTDAGFAESDEFTWE